MAIPLEKRGRQISLQPLLQSASFFQEILQIGTYLQYVSGRLSIPLQNGTKLGVDLSERLDPRDYKNTKKNFFHQSDFENQLF